MLYVVQVGDSLYGIAKKFNTTANELLEGNVICNPNLIFPGQPIIVPDQNLELPRAGGYPYYVVQYGDTLSCIASQFSQNISSLAASNQIPNPNLILAGSELLVRFEQSNPEELFNEWNRMGGVDCDLMSSLQVHGIYYIGSFRFEALGERGVPYLMQLLRHSCRTVRFYAVLSLGRIGRGEMTRIALEQALQDEEPFIAELAKLALFRFQLIPRWTKRIHVLTNNVPLYMNPSFDSTSISLSSGTPIITLRWHVPSPTGEEGPRGDIQIYDFVQDIVTGRLGYIPRVGFNSIEMI